MQSSLVPQRINNGEGDTKYACSETGRSQWRIREGTQTRCTSDNLQSCKVTALEWVSGEQVRIPHEKTNIFRRGILILAAGHPYMGTALPTTGKPLADGWTTDFYGRQVYCYYFRIFTSEIIYRG